MNLDQSVLFVTGSSLSGGTAIGIMTKLLLEPFEDWIHMYWHRGDWSRQDKRSISINSSFASRWPAISSKVGSTPLVGKFLRNWWRDDQLRPDISRRLQKRYSSRVSMMYLAPLSASDAARVRILAQLFQKPFVLHLWDFLDSRVSESQDLRWLIQNAARVLVISHPLMEDIRGLGVNAELLIFSRLPTDLRAVPLTHGELRIAIMGNVQVYAEGLRLLRQALLQLQNTGLQVKVHYIGKSAYLKRAISNFEGIFVPSGFVEDERKDQLLASCHVAFLSGPTKDPEKDNRSRYSIPSRILDFGALGLPIVGTVHPCSATAFMAREHGMSKYLFCSNAHEIARSLTTLLDSHVWNAAHQDSLRAFDSLTAESQPARLKAFMDEVLMPKHGQAAEARSSG